VKGFQPGSLGHVDDSGLDEEGKCHCGTAVGMGSPSIGDNGGGYADAG
jgi:hypothetical protein